MIAGRIPGASSPPSLIEVTAYPGMLPATIDTREITAVVWHEGGNHSQSWAHVIFRSGKSLSVVPPCKGDGSLGPFKKPPAK